MKSHMKRTGFSPKAILRGAARPFAVDTARIESHAISADKRSALKTALEPATRKHSGQSGFMLLPKGKDAWLMRLALIEAAEHGIDLQYYLIEDDLTGKFLLIALLRAADRGVRIRILVDDLNLHGSDKMWLKLSAHPCIEIRIFNPFATRDESVADRVRNLKERVLHFNRRMHNKSMIADNQLAITGGRNLGDEYFDASKDFNLRDLDVLAAGPVVPKLSESFDAYWNFHDSPPIDTLFGPLTRPDTLLALRKRLEDFCRNEMAKETIAFLPSLSEQLMQNALTLEWAEAELAADPPSKIDHPPAQAKSNPWLAIDQAARQARKEVIVVSPYFLPGREATRKLVALAKRGVHVRILTNSLGSTSSVAAHTGYRRYRAPLIEGGVDLYEMKPIPGTHPHTGRFYSRSSGGLHSKVYVIDRRDVIIGSFNFDPRSVHLNTELALVVHSPALAAQVLEKVEKGMSPQESFHLICDKHRLFWLSSEDNREIRYRHEPKATLWRHMKAVACSLLPLEEQL